MRAEELVDWVFDCVGGETLEKCLRLVKDGGQVVTIGLPPLIWDNVKDTRARRGSEFKKANT